MTTLTWIHPKVELLQNQLTFLESKLEEYQNHNESQYVKLSVYNGVEYLFARLIEEFLEPLNIDTLNQGEAAKQQLTNIIDQQLKYTLYTRDNISSSIEHNISSINSTLTQIAVAKEQLENIDQAPRKVSQSIIRKSLITFNGIKSQNSILLREKDGKPFLRFVLDSVISRLDSSELYNCIHSEVGDLHIPISPVTVKIDLITGETAITPYTGWSKYAVYYFNGKYSPHPHVLDTYPCLGDFSAPFRESIENQEWLESVLFIKLFLERVITNDLAGKNWIQYFRVWRNLDSNTSSIYYQGKCYNIWQTKQLGYYELRPVDHDGPVIPHPSNSVFFPGV